MDGAMPARYGAPRPARTVLEQLIRERSLTFEEFAEFADAFGREHGEPGTLSVRHLQRLAAGRRSANGQPLGRLRPATARLLQRIFDLSIEQLLAEPGGQVSCDSCATPQPLQVAVAVAIKESDVLLVHPRERTSEEIRWQFPAGVIKPGMAAEDIAVRETLAETGVHCVVANELGKRVHPLTGVVCNYLLCTYLSGTARNGDIAENASVTWAPLPMLTSFIPSAQLFPPVLDALSSRERVGRAVTDR